MPNTTPLRSLINTLLTDPAAAAELKVDPATFLTGHGYADLDGADVSEAMLLFADELPPSEAQAVFDLNWHGELDGGLAEAGAGLGKLTATVLEASPGSDFETEPDAQFGAGATSIDDASSEASATDHSSALDPDDNDAADSAESIVDTDFDLLLTDDFGPTDDGPLVSDDPSWDDAIAEQDDGAADGLDFDQ